MFIDKPIAASMTDVIAIYKEAAEKITNAAAPMLVSVVLTYDVMRDG